MNEGSLRFAFLTTFYPPFNFGGDGIGIQRLARGLVRAGHQVTVIHDVDAYNLLHRGPEPKPEVDPVGVEVIGLKSGVGRLSLLLTHQLGRPVMNAGRIRELLEEGRFDVINFHNVSLIGGPGLWRFGDALKLHMAHEHWLVCPTHVLWRHGREVCTGRECVRCQLNYHRPPQPWRATGYLEREARHVDAFIAMSEFSREKHREFGFEREMEVLPYFLEGAAGRQDGRTAGLQDGMTAGREGGMREDGMTAGRQGGEMLEGQGGGERGGPAVLPSCRPAALPACRPFFLFVGRLEKIKGLDDVIPLFRGTEGPELVIAGDGEYGPTLRALGEGLPRVRFLGRIPVDQLADYYRQALGLIVPSVCFETFGIILIESFRSGTPVIARAIGPFPEIVQSSGGGLLFTTVAELEAAMARLANEPALRGQLGAAGRAAFEAKWSERAVVPQYLDIVRRAAARKAGGREGGKAGGTEGGTAIPFQGTVR